MMPAGKRQFWMDLELVTSTTDGDGSFTQTPTDLGPPARVKAALEPGRPLEQIREGTVTRTGTYKITMPYHPDLVAGCRIHNGGQVFRVIGVTTTTDMPPLTIADCVERR